MNLDRTEHNRTPASARLGRCLVAFSISQRASGYAVSAVLQPVRQDILYGGFGMKLSFADRRQRKRHSRGGKLLISAVMLKGFHRCYVRRCCSLYIGPHKGRQQTKLSGPLRNVLLRSTSARESLCQDTSIFR